MFPYKIQAVQSLLPTDYQSRLNYAMRFEQLARDNAYFLSHLIMSDETHFYLNGFVNKQNARFWGSDNPRNTIQHRLHSPKCTVWCGIMTERIIGPYFFEDEEGHPERVTGALYRTMIENFLLPEVAGNQQVWFQQDGATAHTADLTMALLRDIFNDRLISRNADFPWPPRSPDLTAHDYFLWGYLKERVYVNNPQTIAELKENILAEVRQIEPDVLNSVMENALQRAIICKQENGGHLKDIIFHT